MTPKNSSACSSSQLYLLLLVIFLIGTQMIMLIATKSVMTVAPLPLLLCEVQFLVSCVSSGLLLFMWKHCCKATPKTDSTVATTNVNSWIFFLPLSLSWTLGFVLFNASSTFMSPSHVNLIRCGEPLATVMVGRMVFGHRYAWKILVTLIPVLGGVWLASPGGVGAERLSLRGTALAGLSNACFCLRPFVLHEMKERQKRLSKDNAITSGMGHKTREQEDLHTFFLVTSLAAFVILPGMVWILEGPLTEQYADFLSNKMLYQDRFQLHLLQACLGFFAYQYIQLRVMSLTSPLGFSILTPVIKAVMIVLCSLYFGDALGIRQIVGVLITTTGGYWFTRTKLQDGGGAVPNSSSPPILPVHSFSPIKAMEYEVPHAHSS